MVWDPELRREAANYMIDSWPYLWAVRAAISRLRETETGLPAEGVVELEAGLLLWQVAEHLLYYLRVVERHKLVMVAIKPQAKPGELVDELTG